MIEEGIASGKTVSELRSDPVEWQLSLLRQDYQLFEGLFESCSAPATDGSPPPPVFTDTSFVETAVFSRRAGIALGPRAEAWLRARRYMAVFFLSPLPTYEGQTAVRQETQDVAAQISEEISSLYHQLGYELVLVPPLPLEDR